MPLLKLVGSTRIAVTRAARKRLEQAAAQNGVALGPIHNREDYREAIIETTSLSSLDQVCRDLLGFSLPTENEIIDKLRQRGLGYAAMASMSGEALDAVCQEMIEARASNYERR